MAFPLVRIVPAPVGIDAEGHYSMKAATILIIGLAAGALTGCSYMHNVIGSTPGGSVEFVSGNASTVLIDYSNDSPGEMKYADAMAKDKCTLFGKSSAGLESLDPRGDGDVMRATYLCH
jgi:hypothetical protein